MVGLLAAPLFKVLGPNLLALKLVALLFGLGVLVLLQIFLRRHFSQQAATFAGLLFIFAPPGYTQNSLVAVGTHAELVLFTMLLLILFYEFLFCKRHSLGQLALFGVCAGVAAFFAYITMLTTASCLLSWVVLAHCNRSATPRFTAGRAVVLLAGLGAGLRPWTIYNFGHGFSGAHLLKLGLFTDMSGQIMNSPVRIFGMLTRSFPLSGLPPPLLQIPGYVFSYLWAAAAAIAIAMFVSSRMTTTTTTTEMKAVPLLIYPALYAAVYGLSRFHLPLGRDAFVEFRYLQPFMATIMILTALALCCLPKKKTWLPVFLGIFGFLGIYGQATLLFREHFARALSYHGYSYYQLAERWKSTTLDLRHFADGLPSPEKSSFLAGIREDRALPLPAPDYVRLDLGRQAVNFWLLCNDDRLRALDRIARLPVSWQAHAREGLTGFEAWSGLRTN